MRLFFFHSAMDGVLSFLSENSDTFTQDAMNVSFPSSRACHVVYPKQLTGAEHWEM